MYILGLNAYHGDSSACIYKSDKLIAATEEERIRRIKHWAGLPIEAIRFCLEEAGIPLSEVDYITVSRNPMAKIGQKAWYALKKGVALTAVRDRVKNSFSIRTLKTDLGKAFEIDPATIKAEIKYIEHHRSHMASAFMVSLALRRRTLVFGSHAHRGLLSIVMSAIFVVPLVGALGFAPPADSAAVDRSETRAPPEQRSRTTPQEGAAAQQPDLPNVEVRPSRPAAGPPPVSRPVDPTAEPKSVPAIDLRTPTSNLENAWTYSRGSTPRPAYVDDSARSLLQINPIGYYQGVTPVGDNPPPFAAESFGVMPAVLTWTGFQRVTGGGSEVFVQLSTTVGYELETIDNRVLVRLPNTTVNVKNNQRRLDTRYFITPVEYVDIRPTTAGTDIIIALRRPAEPTVSQRPGVGGYVMLVVGFGNDAAAAAPDAQPSTRRVPEPPATSR